MTLFSSIEKPTLLLDEAIARRNIARVAEKARSQGIRFRPHFKTHQSIEIGDWFRQAGVDAITVSSLDMALYFANAGWNDITIAFPVNPRQAATLAELARRIKLNLLVENLAGVEALVEVIDKPVDVWIKVDVGAHRTGLPWDQPEAVTQLAKAIYTQENLRFAGLLTHASQTYGGRGAADVCQRYTESIIRLDSLRQAFLSRGIYGLKLSVGDTPSASLCDRFGPVDEIRPGNFIFYDGMQMQIGSCRAEDVAVTVACPVVSLHPERCEAVIYGGAVHLSKDSFHLDGQPVYGYICLPNETGWDAPLLGAYVARLSQEHGVLHLPPEELARLKVGDLVCILPAHSCLTVTLMKRYLTLDGKWIDTLNV